MKLQWFSRKGIFFVPSSLYGGIILIATIAYLVWTFLDIDGRSHSVSDTMMNFVFSALVVAVVYSIIAFFTSAKEEK
jgi:hypothetical protein